MSNAVVQPDGTVMVETDRCDRCGARATTMAVLADNNSVLFLCGHHTNEHAKALVAKGATLFDRQA